MNWKCVHHLQKYCENHVTVLKNGVSASIYVCLCLRQKHATSALSSYAETVILLGHLLATLSPPQQGIVGAAENGQNKFESSTSSSLCCNEMITTQSSSSWIMPCAH